MTKYFGMIPARLKSRYLSDDWGKEMGYGLNDLIDIPKLQFITFAQWMSFTFGYISLQLQFLPCKSDKARETQVNRKL